MTVTVVRGVAATDNPTFNTVSANDATVTGVFSPEKYLHPGYRSQKWYGGATGNTATATVAAVNTIYAHPMRIYKNQRFDAIGFYVATAGSASSAKMAIYSNNYATGLPGTLLAEASGTATTNAIADVVLHFAGSAAVSAASGVVWLASKFTGGTTPQLPGVQTFNTIYSLVELLGSDSPRGQGANPGVAVTGVTATDAFASAFPTTFPSVVFTSANTFPLMSLRAV